jgi:F0F1-type ATP synthase assembly protein I
MAGVGFQFALEVAAGAGLGALVDWKFETAPTGTLVGAGTGLAVGTWTLIKSSRDLLRRWDAEDARRGPSDDASDGTDADETRSDGGGGA